MRPLLRHGALGHHRDAVRVAHRRQPVRDHQRRAPLRQFRERGLDGALRFRVERAGRLVEDQDGRVLEEGAGDGHALLLPAREQHPALAHHRVEALREPLDHRPQPRAPRRLGDLRVGGAEAAVGDVVAQRAGEQEHVLLHDADPRAQRGEGRVAHVHPVHQHAPALDVVEARQQRAERRLARPRRTDERQRRARLDPQRQPAQHGRACRVVAEGHALERDLAARPLRQGPRAGPVHHLGRRGDELEEGAVAGDALGVGLDHRVDLLKGPVEHAHEQQERHEIAHAHRAPRDQDRAGQHHQQLHQPQPEVVQRLPRGHGAVGLELGVAVAGVVGGEEAAFVRLAAEGLDDAHAAHRLLHPRVEGADAAELRLPVVRHPRPVVRHHPAHDGHGEGGDQRERRVDVQHEGEGAGEGEQRHQHVLRPVVRDLADVLEVLRHPAHQVAGLRAVVEAVGECHEVVEGALAQRGLDGDAEHVAPVGHHGHERGVGRVHGEQREHGQHDQVHVARGQQPVHEQPHRHGEAELEHARQRGAAEIERDEAPVRPVQRREALHQGPAAVGGGGVHRGQRWPRPRGFATAAAMGRLRRP